MQSLENKASRFNHALDSKGWWGKSDVTNVNWSIGPVSTGPGSDGLAHYYIDDHLGSTQMELSSGGWPVWSGQFTPFGQEIVAGQVLSATLGNPQPGDGTTMHYKFTGKERDTESGLDYFGARYYASNVGRWISADWAQKPEAVPYSKLDDPQSLNLYEYVGNNPLSRVDADGHGWLLDSLKKVKTDAVAAAKTVSVTVEVGAGLKGEVKSSLSEAHIGASLHGELKVSKNGDEATVKAEVDAGVKANGVTKGGEAGFETTSDRNGMINGVKPYSESEGGVAGKNHEGTSNGEEYSYGGAEYGVPDGFGGGAHVSINKGAVDKVIDDVRTAVSHVIEPKKPKQD